MLLLNDSAATSRGRKPALSLFLAEPLRGIASHAVFPFTAPIMLGARRGDGHGVLVLPGLLGDDLSTLLMRRILKRLGYDVHGWGLGRNVGPTHKIVEGMPRKLDEIADRTGGTVSVIGWSLGGIFARELARRRPETVRDVITLASPFAMGDGDKSRADSAFQLHARRHVPADPVARAQLREPIDIPSTAIYSKTDGIVDWRACVETAGLDHENIAVRASHLGIGVSPAALWVVADRLAQAESSWEPFRPPARFGALYPDPA